MSKVIDRGGSLYEFGGHLDFKTVTQADKFYDNSLHAPLITVIEAEEYEILSVAKNGRRISFLANKIHG